MKKTITTLALLVAMLTGTNVWAYHGTMTGDGSCVNPYTIKDLEDWNTFVTQLNDPAYAPYYADKHYKLGADIGDPNANPPQYATTWAATNHDYPFCGTFDGQGHIIYVDFTQTAANVDPNDETTQGVALFQYVSQGCEILDLNVFGSIHSDYKFAAGIASIVLGGEANYFHSISINRCRSHVSFILGVDGDATSGGLVAVSQNYVFLMMKDCLFDGEYISLTANCCCGMVGFQANNGSTNFEDCYVAPSIVAIPLDASNHNFCRGGNAYIFLTNCRYSSPSFGDDQGDYVTSSTSPEHIASIMGNWVVVDDQPVPATINMVAEHCSMFTGFSVTSSYIPYNTNYDNSENCNRLVDGNRLSKWCVCYPYSTHSTWEPINVCFNYSQRFIPKGYVLTTGNDVKDHPDRLPTAWSLYGWNETTGVWDLLDHHDDDDLPNINSTDRAFYFKNYEDITAEYQQFEFKIEKIAREDKYWDGFFHGYQPNTSDFVCELGEIRIFGTLSDEEMCQLSNCAINGLQPFYYYTGDALPLHYFVTDYYGDELVEYTHYTKEVTRTYGDQTWDNINIYNIVESGVYTMTITGINDGHHLGYFGTNSYTFTVSNPDLPTPMGYTSDYGHAGPYYYVNMPTTGQTTLDLTETDPDFIEPFYVYDDGGYSNAFTPNCNSMLLIKAPDGYGLQLSGKMQSTGYPYTYLTIYDGIDTTCFKLGDDYYGLYGTMQIPTMVSSGQYLLLHFQSEHDYSNMSGLELYVMPFEMPSYNDITLTEAEHGSLTTDLLTDVQSNTQVRLDIHPETGYILQDINATATATSKYVELHGGPWYSGQAEYATFTMPASDVVITSTFAEMDSLYVCMPYYTNDVDQAFHVTIPENITTFRIYDDGGPGGDNSPNSFGMMILEAPENTILEFSGYIVVWSDVNYTSYDYLEIYDGIGYGNLIETFQYGNRDIKINTTGNLAMLLFKSDGYMQLDGFEIQVRVIGKTEDLGITITDVTGGSATVDGGATTAHVNDTVRLNVTTDAGYLCKDFTMTPDCNRPITGGVWHENPSQASFVMPGYDIEITPNITDTLTADGGLYINMPQYNYSYDPKVVTIPAGVTSFKVYDDGGKDGNYSPHCDGYLELHAPLGYFLKLSGNATCNDKGTYHDFLKVFDGDSLSSPPLGNPDGFGYTGGLDFGPLISSGNKMLIYFHTESNSMSGLNLLVEVSNEHFPYIITFDNSDVPANCSIAISGYESVSGTHYVAHVDHTISLNVNCDDNHLCNAFSVKDADGNEIPLSGGLSWYNGNNDTASFTMLPRNLFITYEFVAKGDQYIKIPKKNTVDTPLQVTFPEGITSCKVYDDGGAEANYSDYCNGYALFTAPEGKAWQLTGKVKSEYGSDFMVPYDGDTTTQLIDFYYYGKHTGDGEDIGGLVTFSNQMLIRFYSDYLVNYEGLDLTAELIDPITKTVEGYAAAPAGQDRWAFIAAPMKYYALPENVANLIPETNGIPDPTSSHYDLYRFNQSATLEWENYKSHINDFSLDVGQGYLYANMYTKTLQFGGAVNIGDSKTVALAYDANAGAKGWNLVGNPLLTDAYVDKPYYRMDEFGSNIEPVEHYRLLRVPVCTGIMVQAEGEGESITFSKTLPQFAHKGSLHIAVSGQNTAKDGLTIHDKTIVSFNEGTRLGKYVFNEDVAKLYIQKDGSDFAIAYSEQQGEVPVGFKAVEDGAYTLTITPENVETDYLHLIDNKTGTDIDLLAPELVEGPASYTFTATTMDDELRFRLVFSTHGLHENMEPAQPFAYYADGEIHLLVETQNEATLQVIDMLGRMVDSRDATCHISTSGMMPGVYVLRLMNGNDVKTQKIVIQ